MYFKSLLTSFLCLLLLSGCTSPYSPPTIDPSTARFNGIHPAGMGVKENSLIMIHGMCHHDKSWVRKNRDRLATMFGMQASAIKEIFSDPISKVSAYQTTLTNNEHAITLYGIVYGNATLPIKRDHLCGDVSEASSVCPNITYNRKRARLNAFLKNQLLNDCLSDAVIYLSQEGEKIREGVSQALQSIYLVRKKNPTPVVLLSESLGSKVLRDALLCKSSKRRFDGMKIINDTVQVFLSANQIPLLNLGNGNRCEVSSEVMSLRSKDEPMTGSFFDVLDQLKYQKRRLLPIQPIHVLALTDPNDLLSYEVKSGDYGNYKVTNIIVSNASSWLGLLENPDTAHRGYLDNKDVMKLFKCGYPASACSNQK